MTSPHAASATHRRVVWEPSNAQRSSRWLNADGWAGLLTVACFGRPRFGACSPEAHHCASACPDRPPAPRRLEEPLPPRALPLTLSVALRAPPACRLQTDRQLRLYSQRQSRAFDRLFRGDRATTQSAFRRASHVPRRSLSVASPWTACPIVSNRSCESTPHRFALSPPSRASAT